MVGFALHTSSSPAARHWMLVMVMALCSACSDSPEAGFERFYAAAVARNSTALLAALCDDTRASLLARMGQEALARAVKDNVPKKSVRALHVISLDSTRAELDVEDAIGQRERVVLFKEANGWCVAQGALL